MDCVSEFNHSPQEIRASAEALDDARNLLPARAGSPKVVSSGGFSSGFGVFNDSDFRGRFWGVSVVPAP
jgi:hypothetical protein